jgi:hypothetical protein
VGDPQRLAGLLQLTCCTVLDGDVIRRMDLSTKELETLTELELAAFSVLVHCRKYVITLVLSFGNAGNPQM